MVSHTPFFVVILLRLTHCIAFAFIPGVLILPCFFFSVFVFD